MVPSKKENFYYSNKLENTSAQDTISFKSAEKFNEEFYKNTLEMYDKVYMDNGNQRKRFTDDEKKNLLKSIKEFKTDGEKEYFWKRLMSIKHWDHYPDVYYPADDIINVLKIMSGRNIEEQMAIDAVLSWEDLHTEMSITGANLLRYGDFNENFDEYLDVAVKLNKKLISQNFPLDDRGQCIGDTLYFCTGKGYKYLPLWDKLSERLKDLIDAEDLFCYYQKDLSPEKFYKKYLDWMIYKVYTPLYPDENGEGSYYHHTKRDI